jgi:hypothetical protein
MSQSLTSKKDIDDVLIYRDRLVNDFDEEDMGVLRKAEKRLRELTNAYNEAAIELTSSEDGWKFVYVCISTMWCLIIPFIILAAIFHGSQMTIGTVTAFTFLLFYMLGNALCCIHFAIVDFTLRILVRDARFAGARPAAPIKERIASLWADPAKQKRTDHFFLQKIGLFASGCIYFDTDVLLSNIDSIYSNRLTHANTDFKGLSTEERVRVVCQRALVIYYSNKKNNMFQ